MRNRALVAEHLRVAGVYSASGFAIGTCLVFAKEAVRLLLVERTVVGFGALWNGWVDGRKLARLSVY
jgi:rhamnopyranosyl-N-acetylglucosaminyl-diphospho-decaprenol beta-1,3/1,4-galactofuranosyltransferase